MVSISAIEYYSTSVTLRGKSVRHVTAARRLLRRYGIYFSESRLLEELLRLYLGFWQGHGPKPATLRRYNKNGQAYQIRPWYVNRVLHAAATQRAMHTGESLSRMVDFAIRAYRRRFVESVLSAHRVVPVTAREAWKKRYSLRFHPGAFFISYKSQTARNAGADLFWRMELEIIPKQGLSMEQILSFTRNSA